MEKKYGSECVLQLALRHVLNTVFKVREHLLHQISRRPSTLKGETWGPDVIFSAAEDIRK